jgi:hypothetical protein
LTLELALAPELLEWRPAASQLRRRWHWRTRHLRPAQSLSFLSPAHTAPAPSRRRQSVCTSLRACARHSLPWA